MKHFILILAACLTLIANLNGQWEILNEGGKGRFTTIDFVSDHIGWIASSKGTLLNTEDGGQTWNSLPQDENYYIETIDFINDSIGWGIGTVANNFLTEDIILKTKDGGQTWLTQKIFIDCNLSSIYVVNDSVIYIIGSQFENAKIFKTSNGGSSWEDISPQNCNKITFESLWFFNADTGIVSGFHSDIVTRGIIFRTYDGGNSWGKNILPGLVSISNFQFINDSTGYFLARNDLDETLLCETKNMCRDWSIRTKNSFSSYYFIDNEAVYSIISTERFLWGNPRYLIKSSDGGKTWQQKFNLGNLFLDKIYFCNEKNGFIIGGGTIFKTVDQGNSWTIQKLGYNFQDVFFIDRNRGVATGGGFYLHLSYGDMFVTRDEGRTWELSFSPAQKVQACWFVNNSIGFALGRIIEGQSWIYKTTDSGNKWNGFSEATHTSAATFEGIDMCFINEKIGWVVGSLYQDSSGAAIIATINGGVNWDLVWFKKNEPEQRNLLNSIYFLNENTGWAVGDGGLIVKHTAPDHWEEQAAITDLPLNDVFFSDEKNGWIAGGYDDNGLHSILLRTIDGGNNWGKNSNLPVLIHDIYFHNVLHGWAVGYDETGKGVILETRDGGDYWTVRMDNLIGPLNALSYRDNFLWAVGDCGLVLRTAVDSTTGVEAQQHNTGSQSYKLMQNYPNPFNATTAISYQLSALSQVELSIYNLLGQKVLTLVSEKQPAGSYKVDWDGAEFSSGVYFCRMEAGIFVKVIKLALIK